MPYCPGFQELFKYFRFLFQKIIKETTEKLAAG
jgi:hypothetical protein